MSGRLSDRSLVKNGAPVNGTVATAGRSRKNRPKPAATPMTAATADSMAEITDTCRGVAPASRMAANRCSRRAADSRVAAAMKISTGNSSAAATTERIRSMPLALMPTSTAQLLPLQPLGGIDWMLVTLWAPGTRESWPGVCPTMMISAFGAGSPAGPIVPAWCPGNRSPSCAAGVVRSRRLRAGEA